MEMIPGEGRVLPCYHLHLTLCPLPYSHSRPVPTPSPWPHLVEVATMLMLPIITSPPFPHPTLCPLPHPAPYPNPVPLGLTLIPTLSSQVLPAQQHRQPVEGAPAGKCLACRERNRTGLRMEDRDEDKTHPYLIHSKYKENKNWRLQG